MGSAPGARINFCGTTQKVIRDRNFQIWRRRRDSNPRYAFGAYNGLANRRLQPLGHVSLCEKAYSIHQARSNSRSNSRCRLIFKYLYRKTTADEPKTTPRNVQARLPGGTP